MSKSSVLFKDLVRDTGKKVIVLMIKNNDEDEEGDIVPPGSFRDRDHHHLSPRKGGESTPSHISKNERLLRNVFSDSDYFHFEVYRPQPSIFLPLSSITDVDDSNETLQIMGAIEQATKISKTLMGKEIHNNKLFTKDDSPSSSSSLSSSSLLLDSPLSSSSSSSPLQMIDGEVEGEMVKQYHPLILIKENSVCNLSPEEMRERIQVSLETTQADIYYLCKWKDSCQEYEHTSTSWLKKTYSPEGVQAILLTPRFVEIILGGGLLPSGKKFTIYDHNLSFSLKKFIKEGDVRAICFIPNIIHYDIEKAKSTEDFEKMNECDTNVVRKKKGIVSTTSFLWLILIFLSLFALAWLVCE